MKRFCMALCLCALPIATFSHANHITLTACGHHDYAPWNWKSGDQIQGACAAVTKSLFEKLGVGIDLTYVGPWKRCLYYIKTGKVDVNICSFINDERKQYAEYIGTPMGFNQNAVFVKKGSEFPLYSWSDLAGKKAGMVLGVSIGQEFDDFLNENTTIESVSNFKQNFQKLYLGRIDFIPVGRFAGRSILHKLDLDGEIVDLPTPLLTGDLHISMSKKSPYLSLLPKIEKLMQADDYDQWVESLLQKYSEIYAEEFQ